jgi:K+:H+ antiporter
MARPATGGTTAHGFGRFGRSKTLVFYVSAVACALVLLKVILLGGAHLRGPRPVSTPSSTAAGQNTSDLFWRLLVAIAVVVSAARLIGSAFRRVRQPVVVGEIVAGIVLGPSVFGGVWPGASRAVFGPHVLPYLDVLSQIGLIFFMFLIGLELDVRLIRGRGQAATAVSHVSIIVPFLLGSTSALVLFPTLGSAKGKFLPFALFLGASMSITAFPVLARILSERGLSRTQLGAVALTCAAVDDVTAWCLLAVVVAIVRSHGTESAVVTIVLALAFIALMVGVVRPFMSRLASYHEAQGQLGAGTLTLLFVGIVLSALATDRIGIHAIFGAFLFGAVMPQRSELILELVGKLEDFVVLFLLPLFFAFTGLRTRIGLIGRDPHLWLLTGLILAVAVGGKWGGTAAAGRVVGLSWREASALGVLMNTRGLTELIILNIGLDLGVIPPTLFAMLVLMALTTTFIAVPILSLLYPSHEVDEMIRTESPEADEAPPPWRVLVPLASARSDHELVGAAVKLSSGAEQAQIILLRGLQVPGSPYRSGRLALERLVERTTGQLRALVGVVERTGIEAVPLVIPTSSPARTIVRVARERDPDLVLLGWHHSLFGKNLLGGSVGEVLRDAPSNVAVLVDPARRGIDLTSQGHIVVPCGGGFHEDMAVELAVRLALTSGCEVVLLGAADEEGAHQTAERAARVYEATGVHVSWRPVSGTPMQTLVRWGQDADLVVLGVSDTWATNKHSVGELRSAFAARTGGSPVLVVRRHGQPGGSGPARWLSRRKEWLEEAGGTVESIAGAPART